MNDVLIYREYVGNPKLVRFYDEGPHQMIIYHPGAGLLNVIDQREGERIAISISRWKLMQIGWGCVTAAIWSKGGPRRQLSAEEEQERKTKRLQWLFGLPIVILFLLWLLQQ